MPPSKKPPPRTNPNPRKGGAPANAPPVHIEIAPLVEQIRGSRDKANREWARMAAEAAANPKRASRELAKLAASEVQPTLPVRAGPRVPHIPSRWAETRLDTFHPKPSHDDPNAESSQRRALKLAQAFVDRVTGAKCHGAMLALVGPEGVGKSHLLYGAANALIAAGVEIYARPWYRLGDELRYGGHSVYDDRLRLEPFEVRDALWRARVIFLDEVRKTSGTEFDDTELHKLSCMAYDEQRFVMLTTNVTPLSDVMGPFAASRYTIHTITGEDQRNA